MSLSKLTEAESQVLLVGNFNPNFEEWEDVRPATSEEAQLGLVQCEQCEGRGSWPFPTRQVCPACGGKRAIRVKAWLVEPCTTCNGTGTPTDHVSKSQARRLVVQNPCSDCGGFGVVPSEQAIEVVAKALTWQRFGEPQDFASEVMDMQIPVTLIGEARAVVEALLKGTE